MDAIYPSFWTSLIFCSIAWYAILLFVVGGKGGAEIIQMIRLLLLKQRKDR